MKMWEGRFGKELDDAINDFNASIRFDQVMYRQDITGSMAHAGMLGAQGIIPGKDAAAIQEGLAGILADLESGALAMDPGAEDIHMFVEQELTARIGQAGKRLHTARSRNDQVALDLRMYLKEQAAAVKQLVLELIAEIASIAKAHTRTVMPGYTHLQVAQPVTFAHHLLAYAQMLRRDAGRLSDFASRIDEMPLGACALAGTTYPINRHMVAKSLGFARVTENSIDSVADRDFCVELGAALCLVMTHLSRLSEEVVLWCSSEFGFVELDDAFATGSSIMPQKKNPDITELVRGKTGRVTGSMVTLLTMLKGLPLAYNKDMQEDKEAIFDALATTKACLSAIIPMLHTMIVKPERMRAAAAKGFINATDCADYLAKKGVPFRDAYKITGQLVRLCIEKGCTLETLPLEQYKAVCPEFEADIYASIDLITCVSQRASYGGPAPQAVEVQLENLRTWLSSQP